MAARGWKRVGCALFVAAVVGLAVYMASVGWDKASLIATVGALFVAIAGLVVAVRPPVSRQRGGVQVTMANVRSGEAAVQSADVPAGTPVVARINRVSGRTVWQRIRAHAGPADEGDEGSRDA